MEDSMKILDARGRKIIKGSIVRYVGFDTTGKVDKICI